MLDYNYNTKRYFDNVEIAEFIKVLKPEFEGEGGIYKISEQLYFNTLPSTADLHGIEKWEKLLYITPESDDLERRRQMVLRRILPRMPVTEASLTQWVNDYFGIHGSEITVDPIMLTLYVDVPGEDRRLFGEFSNALIQLIPANLLPFVRRIARPFEQANFKAFKCFSQTASITHLSRALERPPHKGQMRSVCVITSITGVTHTSKAIWHDYKKYHATVGSDLIVGTHFIVGGG